MFPLTGVVGFILYHFAPNLQDNSKRGSNNLLYYVCLCFMFITIGRSAKSLYLSHSLILTLSIKTFLDMLLQLLERFGSPSVTAKETKIMLNMLLYLYKSTEVGRIHWENQNSLIIPGSCLFSPTVEVSDAVFEIKRLSIKLSLFDFQKF